MHSQKLFLRNKSINRPLLPLAIFVLVLLTFDYGPYILFLLQTLWKRISIFNNFNNEFIINLIKM